MQGGSATSMGFLKKEYEIVLVALPSHSAVALFSVDFASLVQQNTQDLHKSFHISPLKCRDLAATLEFDISWELEDNTGTNTMMRPSTPKLVGRSPSSTILSKSSQPPKPQTPKAQTPRSRQASKSRRSANDTMSLSSRRTTTSSSSAGSERELLEELSSSNCSNCRSAKRRLDRKDVQVLQLETFLKESQKRIDALCVENDELIIRENAETCHAAQQRALTLRLLQELEVTVQLCTEKMQNKDSMMLPQIELIERVKKLHAEADPLNKTLETAQHSHKNVTFDFHAEMVAALQRNKQLQLQLEFLAYALHEDRAATDVSGTTDAVPSYLTVCSVKAECESRPVALTMTQQLNNLERENFKLRNELEGALASVASALKKCSVGFSSTLSTAPSLTAEISETTSTCSRDDMEEPEHENAVLFSRIREQHELEAARSAALQLDLNKAEVEINKLKKQLDPQMQSKEEEKEPLQAPGFLDKIYADVGKAKLMLEDRVSQLDEMLASAAEENGRLRNQIEELQRQMKCIQDKSSNSEKDFDRLLKQRENDIQAKEVEIASIIKQLQDVNARAHASESAKITLENELATVRVSLQRTQLSLSNTTSLTPSVAHFSATSDATAHNDELAEVQKQLKLSKQEVMQLRFRSNQFESVNERLEEALKEKRTLEVKLTALEGQLFEQRGRTINPGNSCSSANDVKKTAMLAEMQHELDKKSAQLMIAKRDIDQLRSQVKEDFVSSSRSSSIDEVADKVKQCEDEISRLCQRNDEQTRKLQTLGDRVKIAVRERNELEKIVQQMVTEMSLLGKDVKYSFESCNSPTSATSMIDQIEEKSYTVTHSRSSPSVVATGKITDRYDVAVASSSNTSHTPSSLAPIVTSSKVAELMKTFSPNDADLKRPAKVDTRNRKASSISNDNSSL